jgi:eukaryotic-like serine/threonine-protein kinase
MMPRSSDPPDRDLDDGTWHQPSTGVGSTPRAGSSASEVLTDSSPPTQSVPTPIPIAAPTPPPAGDSKDSADSGESTPRPPGTERTDEWDLTPPPTIRKGELIFGTYLLEEKIGEGGMGEVWLVENVPLQRQSALKLIKPGIAQNVKGWRRFEREARVMAKLTHPNAVAVYAFKRASSMGYIEMEFVKGRSIDKYLAEREGAPMSLEWTAKVLSQLCAVLQEAHENFDEKKGKPKPIIHRDLKPSNLMLADRKPSGQNLKVLDFGIAKMVEDDGSPDVTGAGDLVGTPAYMSPEQIRGGYASPEQIRGVKTKAGKSEVDGRSDLYSVGVLLYQFLTGSLPFKEMNKMETLVAHLHIAPRPFKEVNRNIRVPQQVERLVMKCLEKEPEKRPQSARELAEEFQAAIGDIKKTERVRRAWMALAAWSMAACVLAAALLVGADRVRRWSHRSAGPAPPETEKKPPEREKPPENGLRNAWVPPGYEGITRGRLETKSSSKNASLEYLATDADLGDAPAGLLRKDDNVLFYCFRSGVYLPLGYRPEDTSALAGFWPKALIRQVDGVKFIRILGGPYTRGDFRPGKPVADLKGNPCQPHEIEVDGFYVQDTEVTNEEIVLFAQTHPDVPLGGWTKGFEQLMDILKKPRSDVLKYPAVFINRATAQRYAQSVGGTLPTEGEWEFVARSLGQDYLWAGKSQRAKRTPPKARLYSIENVDDPWPVAVKSFAGEDETDQMVFDMTGNVREWCLDVYKPYSDIIKGQKPTSGEPLAGGRLVNPRVGGEPEIGDSRTDYVVRGGSFSSDSDVALTFKRNAYPADTEDSDLGFRVVIKCPARDR